MPIVRQRKSVAWRCLPALAAVAVLCNVRLARASSAAGTEPAYATTLLRVLPQPGLAGKWRVGRAVLKDDFVATWGFLDVTNISRSAQPQGAFYAEYVDDGGFVCFSLVFSQTANTQDRATPLAPGETRTLVSLAASLGPAVEPKELKLYLLRQWRAATVAVAGEGFPVTAPVTIGGGVPASWSRLWLGPELTRAKGPMLDLVLAQVDVDAAGHQQDVDIVQAASGAVSSWFRDFVHQLGFLPASSDGLDEPGRAWILARALVSQSRLGDSAYPLWECPWVQRYATLPQPDGTILPVNEILFQHPPTHVQIGGSSKFTDLPKPPPGLFDYDSWGTDWSSNVLSWVMDPDSHRLTREWKGTQESRRVGPK